MSGFSCSAPESQPSAVGQLATYLTALLRDGCEGDIRLSESDRAMLMGGTLQKAYDWAP